MKLKLKLLTAALAIGFAAGANAAIDDGSVSGNGELFLNVFNSTGSYTRDLGLTISNFTASNTSFAADAGLTSFLASNTGVSWDVVAAGQAASPELLVATFTPSTGLGNITATGTKLFGVSTTQIGDNTMRPVIGAVQGLAININAATDAGGSFANNVSGTFLASDAGYSGNSGTFGALKFNTSTAFNVAGTSTLDVLQMAVKTGGTAASTYSQFQYLNAGVATPTQFSMDSAGNLSLTAASVAAVPEPETYGMLAAGLLMLGAVARRRGNRA